jgi:hypothetical protein
VVVVFESGLSERTRGAWRRGRVKRVQGKVPAGGLGVFSRSPSSPRRVGARGVETRSRRQRWWAQPTLRDGGGGFRSAPSALQYGFPLPVSTRTSSAGMTRQVQQDAAEGLGVSPNSLFYPPRLGDRGLKASLETALCRSDGTVQIAATCLH